MMPVTLQTDRLNTKPLTLGRGGWGAWLAGFLFVLTLLSSSIVLPTQAHSQLISSDPAPGTTLEFPPYQIVLNFNEPMGEPTRVLLIDENFASTELEVLIADKTLFAQMPALGAGVFTVQYDAVSADGHPISGSYEFAVVLQGGDGITTGTAIAIGATLLLMLLMMFFHFRSRARIRHQVRLQQQANKVANEGILN